MIINFSINITPSLWELTDLLTYLTTYKPCNNKLIILHYNCISINISRKNNKVGIIHYGIFRPTNCIELNKYLPNDSANYMAIVTNYQFLYRIRYHHYFLETLKTFEIMFKSVTNCNLSIIICNFSHLEKLKAIYTLFEISNKVTNCTNKSVDTIDCYFTYRIAIPDKLKSSVGSDTGKIHGEQQIFGGTSGECSSCNIHKNTKTYVCLITSCHNFCSSVPTVPLFLLSGKIKTKVYSSFYNSFSCEFSIVNLSTIFSVTFFFIYNSKLVLMLSNFKFSKAISISLLSISYRKYNYQLVS